MSSNESVSNKPYPSLAIQIGLSDQQEYHVLDREKTLIGRHSGCEIPLNHDSVSRQHAVITRTANGYLLEDLNSTNGTTVNSIPVTRHLLKVGDIIYFGTIKARFIEYQTDLETAAIVSPSATLYLQMGDIAKERAKLQFVYDLADAAANVEEEGEIVRVAMEVIQRQLKCENTYIGLIDDATGKIDREFFLTEDGKSQQFKPSQTVITGVLAKHQPLLVMDIDNAEELRTQKSVLSAKLRSVGCIPMMVAGETAGIIYVDTRQRISNFSKDDVAYICAIGSLLGTIIRHLRTVHHLRDQYRALQQKLEGEELIGEEPCMVETKLLLQKFASKGEAPVLIYGESGTGKELAARSIFRLSKRADKPFLAVNCAAVPKDLMESELFGHVKGAFTSATTDRHGLFELAEGGILLLDEIGEMPVGLQSKLLRVLETSEYRPVGSEKIKKANVRVIAATNADPDQAVANGTLRQDLLFRLKVLSLEMPPLREHRKDIPRLARHFLNELRCGMATRVRDFSPKAMELLQQHPWPGNVRQLKNAIEQALYVSEDVLLAPGDLAELQQKPTQPTLPQPQAPQPATTPQMTDQLITDQSPKPQPPAINHNGGKLENRIEELEKAQISEALDRNHWNKSKTALELGISRKKLLARIKQFHLE